MDACLTTTKIFSGCNPGKQDDPIQIHIDQKQGNNKNTRKEKLNSRKKGVPCGKRTDFEYLKGFDKDYSIGKLLGHGQSGYTYVAIDKDNGDRVAVKKIDKNKVKKKSKWVMIEMGSNLEGELIFPYLTWYKDARFEY